MVKSGDTMYTIAQKYGVKLEQLIAFNPQISNPDQIEVGMKVKIPSAVIHDGTPAVDYAHKHVVVQGDSLWKIAKAWGLPLKALVDANPQLKNPSVLLTGEIVNIPKSAHMQNQGTFSTMSAAQTPVQPNISNNISPAYFPKPINMPQPAIAPEAIIVNQTPPKPVEQLTQPEAKLPVEAEASNENMHIQPSETLFMQFDVPAVEATGKAENMPVYPTYALPESNPAEMPQWEPMPSYAAKPDCGCGCGGKANTMPYNQNPASYSSMPTYYIPEPMLGYSMQDPMQQAVQPSYYNPMQENMAMPMQQAVQPSYYNPMQDNMAMPMQQAVQPSYYNPMQDNMAMPMQQAVQPSYYYPMQDNMAMPMQQAPQPSYYNPMQFPASAAPASSYGYMVPCYPMGAYGDMSYLHGMQTPYSPWINSNESTPPVNTLAESSENANISEHVNGVLGIADTNEPVKKRTKIPRKSSNRSSQKQNDRVLLHNFLQKKSSGGETARELKINEPWMNR
jgi:spore coat assembly protein SafA